MNREANRLRELLAVSRAIVRTTDYDEALKRVVETACALTKADASLLLLADPGGPTTIVASAGVVPAKARDGPVVLDERLGATLRERFDLGSEDLILAVPMILRGDVRGSLAIVRRKGPVVEKDASPSEDEFFLSALADQATIALGHAAHLSELEAALAAAQRERRAREEVVTALSAERGWLRAVVDHSPIAVLLVEGKSGGRVTANARAEQLFGRPISADVGIIQQVGCVCSPEGTPLLLAELPATEALHGEVVNRELAVRRPDGTMVPVRVHAASICDERSGILGAAVLYEDISALKSLERLREEWTCLIAHDLRQPVGAISFRAHMLLARQDGGLDPPTRRAVEHILTSAQRLARMIDDLLDSSLLETRRLVLARSPCAVSPVLAEAIELNASATSGHPVELSVAEDLPCIDVDRGRIEQVLTNLLGNAAKYGAPGTPIEVRADRHGDAVEVTILNHGLGVDLATIGSVFERFQRGQTMGPKGEGLGLGLYISRGLIEAHGGKIWVECTPQQTTAFHFTMPTCAAPREGTDHA